MGYFQGQQVNLPFGQFQWIGGKVYGWFSHQTHGKIPWVSHRFPRKPIPYTDPSRNPKDAAEIYDFSILRGCCKMTRHTHISHEKNIPMIFPTKSHRKPHILYGKIMWHLNFPIDFPSFSYVSHIFSRFLVDFPMFSIVFSRIFLCFPLFLGFFYVFHRFLLGFPMFSIIFPYFASIFPRFSLKPLELPPKFRPI